MTHRAHELRVGLQAVGVMLEGIGCAGELVLRGIGEDHVFGHPPHRIR